MKKEKREEERRVKTKSRGRGGERDEERASDLGIKNRKSVMI